MVNTFVTSSSLEECAKSLDWRRLGKQRVEAYQIWRVLTGKTTGRGWKNHPAVLAWQGHTCALAMYTNVMIREWIFRGYNNTMELLPHCKNPQFPWWWGWKPVIMSHKASLNRKMPEYYSFEIQDGYEEYGYVWPSKISEDLRTCEDVHLLALKI